jgi:hypothetical protein
MNELIAILIIGGFGAVSIFLVIKAISSAAGASKKVVDRSIVAVKGVANSLREEALKRKIVDIANDEYVRMLVRRALKDNIDPNTFDVCKKCRGHGCSQCNDSGWARIS